MKPSGALRLAAALGVVAALVGCAPRTARNAAPVLRVLLTNSGGDSAMLGYAAFAREERRSGELLWLVTGTGLQGSVGELLTDGAAAVDRLDALGVDACLFGPGWLAYGPARASELAGNARCFVLGANVTDTARAAFGQALMVRRTAIGVVGICGVWPDSTDPLLAQRGVSFVGAERAAAVALPVLRQRSDVCLLLCAGSIDSTAAGWDGVLGCGPDSSLLLEVSLAGGTPAIRRVAFDPAVTAPDSTTVLALARLNNAGERRVRAAGPGLSAAVISRDLATSFLADNRADCLLAPGRLWSGGDVAGAVTDGQLLAGLPEPARWVVAALSWTELNRSAAGNSLTVTVRAGRLPSKKGQNRAWRVLIPVRYAGTVVTKLGAGYELTARPLWTLAEMLLESGSNSQ